MSWRLYAGLNVDVGYPMPQWKRYRPDTKRMDTPSYAASPAVPGGPARAVGRSRERGPVGLATSDWREKELIMARPGDLQVGWQYRAACKGPQSHLFFPPNHIERKQERQRRERAAKAICRECPVVQECREYALMVREPHGIWGGLNEYERRQALARRAG
jgi:WhiB family transcriptional regulator, redox-sensing transcriptional regulator